LELADLIKNDVSQVDDKLTERGIKKLSEKAFDLLESGVTSLEEVYSLLMD
jgi:type II secretory ATPase GspE/PulE/Tfp pilus assembly ATPase PilB-like protein